MPAIIETEILEYRYIELRAKNTCIVWMFQFTTAVFSISKYH